MKYKEMRRYLNLLIALLIIQPVYAQVDSGYRTCNLKFIESIVAIDTKNLKPTDYDLEYSNLISNWNKCIQNYKAPPFTGITLDNDTITLNKIYNRVIVLNFWSLNCPPCMVELDVLDTLISDYKRKDVVFISICYTSKYKILKVLRPKIKTIPDAKEIFNQYGIVGYPQTLVIGKNHMIKHQFIGINVNNAEELKNQLIFEIDNALVE